MDPLEDIHFDLLCIVERAQRHLQHLQIKRLVNSDKPFSYFDYSSSQSEHNLQVFKNMNNSRKPNYTLKDFQGYFKVLRQLSQYRVR